MGKGKLNKAHLFSDCLTEQDVNYRGNDLNGGDTVQPDVESCRSSCSSMGATYFTYRVTVNRCFCKNSNVGRTSTSGFISGDTSCLGEMSFCLTFYSMMHTADIEYAGVKSIIGSKAPCACVLF